ncbi:MAG TPA: glutathione S-transferase [Marinagarivorans sp.]
MLPILYSFRRCPYAMRARLALAMCECAVELREVSLKRKPASMLAVSPKGTVPVLDLSPCSGSSGSGGKPVLDESLEIMRWAVAQRLARGSVDLSGEVAPRQLDDPLVAQTDGSFKMWLDRYKYADRHPEFSLLDSREQAAQHVWALEAKLNSSHYLSGEAFGVLDAAIAPFIRQFAGVEPQWFAAQAWPKVIYWLEQFKSSALFAHIMVKYGEWSPQGAGLIEHWGGHQDG